MYDFRVKIYFVGSVENVLIIHKNDDNILVSRY